jgi:hypothetical protein
MRPKNISSIWIAAEKPRALILLPPKRALQVPVSGLETNDPSSRPEALPLDEPSLLLSHSLASYRPWKCPVAGVLFALRAFWIAPCHAPPLPIRGSTLQGSLLAVLLHRRCPILSVQRAECLALRPFGSPSTTQSAASPAPRLSLAGPGSK